VGFISVFQILLCGIKQSLECEQVLQRYQGQLSQNLRRKIVSFFSYPSMCGFYQFWEDISGIFSEWCLEYFEQVILKL